MRFKFIFLCIIFGSWLVGNAQKNLPYSFANLKYDKIIAYDCKPKPDRKGGLQKGGIAPGGKLDTTIFINKKTLDKKQTDSLQKFLLTTSQISSPGQISSPFPSECFYPHLGFVYYNKDKIVADFTICFDCNYFIIYVTVFKKGCEDCATNHRMIFSPVGRKKLLALCADLKFSCNKAK